MSPRRPANDPANRRTAVPAPSTSPMCSAGSPRELTNAGRKGEDTPKAAYMAAKSSTNLGNADIMGLASPSIDGLTRDGPPDERLEGAFIVPGPALVTNRPAGYSGRPASWRAAQRHARDHIQLGSICS